jgi:hypothetical protein
MHRQLVDFGLTEFEMTRDLLIKMLTHQCARAGHAAAVLGVATRNLELHERIQRSVLTRREADFYAKKISDDE